jgi:antitoxin HicB
MTEMNARRPLTEYLELDYPFQALADPDGGYVIVFPDLPGAMTQVESIEEIGAAVAEIKALWIETEYGRGREIPMPTYPEQYSGKFNVRIPKSLHRRLAEQADNDGVSLNQYVVALLAAGAERGLLGDSARNSIASPAKSRAAAD